MRNSISTLFRNMELAIKEKVLNLKRLFPHNGAEMGRHKTGECWVLL